MSKKSMFINRATPTRTVRVEGNLETNMEPHEVSNLLHEIGFFMYQVKEEGE